LHETPRFTAEAFDENIRRALKWSIGAETMEDLVSAHEDVKANRVPSVIQFGSGPLSLIDPSQAPPGKHTTYAWHVMPFSPEIGDRSYEDFRAEFAEKIIETWGRYCPNMTSKNIIGQHVYTAQEYVLELPNMRNVDIFMGAFSAEQVMYNHFGYRTPVGNLYLSGSASHPGGSISGGAGYITAGLIARDLSIRPWWTPGDAAKDLSELESMFAQA
jgi:phytoene dehydrogenase-like protein